MQTPAVPSTGGRVGVCRGKYTNLYKQQQRSNSSLLQSTELPSRSAKTRCWSRRFASAQLGCPAAAAWGVSLIDYRFTAVVCFRNPGRFVGGVAFSPSSLILTAHSQQRAATRLEPHIPHQRPCSSYIQCVVDHRNHCNNPPTCWS